MEDNKYIRTKERLEYLKKEFETHVLDTSQAIRETRKDIKEINKRSESRDSSMQDMKKGIDDILRTLNDDNNTSRKGVTSITIENRDRLSVLETEAKAWKRAAIIIGGLIGGLATVSTYAWAIVKKMITNEIN